MATSWPVPDSVGVDGKYLRWEFYFSKSRPIFSNTVSPKAPMLENFLSLDGASKARIAAYARTWGLLELERHRVPVTDGATDYKPKTERVWTQKVRSGLKNSERFWGRESLHAWRYWARKFGAFLRVGSRLNDNQPPDPKDWELAIFDTPICFPSVKAQYYGDEFEWTTVHDSLVRAWQSGQFLKAEKYARELHDRSEKVLQKWDPLSVLFWHSFRVCLPGVASPWYVFDTSGEDLLADCSQRAVNKLTSIQRLGHVNIRLNYERRLEVTTETLFAGLCWQLLNTFGTGGVAICSECGGFYRPKRKPSATRNNYCDECGRKASVRRANRRYQLRKRLDKDAETPRE